MACPGGQDTTVRWYLFQVNVDEQRVQGSLQHSSAAHLAGQNHRCGGCLSPPFAAGSTELTQPRWWWSTDAHQWGARCGGVQCESLSKRQPCQPYWDLIGPAKAITVELLDGQTELERVQNTSISAISGTEQSEDTQSSALACTQLWRFSVLGRAVQGFGAHEQADQHALGQPRPCLAPGVCCSPQPQGTEAVRPA